MTCYKEKLCSGGRKKRHWTNFPVGCNQTRLLCPQWAGVQGNNKCKGQPNFSHAWTEKSVKDMWKHTTLIFSLSRKITTSTSDCCQLCCQETQWDPPPLLQFPALLHVKIISEYGYFTGRSWNQSCMVVLDTWLHWDRGEVRSALATLCPVSPSTSLPSLLLGRELPPPFWYLMAVYNPKSDLSDIRARRLANRKTLGVIWLHLLDWGIGVAKFHTESSIHGLGLCSWIQIRAIVTWEVDPHFVCLWPAGAAQFPQLLHHHLCCHYSGVLSFLPWQLFKELYFTWVSCMRPFYSV